MAMRMRIEAFLWTWLCLDYRALEDMDLCCNSPGTKLCMDPVSRVLMRLSSPPDFKILMEKNIAEKASMFQPQQEFTRQMIPP